MAHGGRQQRQLGPHVDAGLVPAQQRPQGEPMAEVMDARDPLLYRTLFDLHFLKVIDA